MPSSIHTIILTLYIISISLTAYLYNRRYLRLRSQVKTALQMIEKRYACKDHGSSYAQGFKHGLSLSKEILLMMDDL